MLVLGHQAGGKTSLINRFLTGQYVASQLHSVSQATTHQKLHYVGDTRIKFLIKESEPSEEALKETDVILLCFSLETSVSLAGVVSHWSGVSGSVPLLLVGTKSDARQSQANTYQQAQAVASPPQSSSWRPAQYYLSYQDSLH